MNIKRTVYFIITYSLINIRIDAANGNVEIFTIRRVKVQKNIQLISKNTLQMTLLLRKLGKGDNAMDIIIEIIF
jgi:hypothetical protein